MWFILDTNCSVIIIIVSVPFECPQYLSDWGIDYCLQIVATTYILISSMIALVLWCVKSTAEEGEYIHKSIAATLCMSVSSSCSLSPSTDAACIYVADGPR